MVLSASLRYSTIEPLHFWPFSYLYFVWYLTCLWMYNQDIKSYNICFYHHKHQQGTDFYDMLLKYQSRRYEDQRCSLPLALQVRTPTLLPTLTSPHTSTYCCCCHHHHHCCGLWAVVFYVFHFIVVIEVLLMIIVFYISFSLWI